MRALGEVAVEHPVSGSFSAHATAFLGPKLAILRAGLTGLCGL